MSVGCEFNDSCMNSDQFGWRCIFILMEARPGHFKPSRLLAQLGYGKLRFYGCCCAAQADLPNAFKLRTRYEPRPAKPNTRDA